MQVLVIGIGGVTNSGKSTLVSLIKKRYPESHIIGQDAYFLYEGHKNVEFIKKFGRYSWELLSSLDMELMVEHVANKINEVQHLCSSQEVIFTRERPSIIIIEGFLIFNYRQLSSLLTHKYYMSVDKFVCKERRSERARERPPDTREYFDDHVWPTAMKYKEELLFQTDIVYLDGTDPPEHLCDRVCQDIQALPPFDHVDYQNE